MGNVLPHKLWGQAAGAERWAHRASCRLILHTPVSLLRITDPWLCDPLPDSIPCPRAAFVSIHGPPVSPAGRLGLTLQLAWGCLQAWATFSPATCPQLSPLLQPAAPRLLPSESWSHPSPPPLLLCPQGCVQPSAADNRMYCNYLFKSWQCTPVFLPRPEYLAGEEHIGACHHLYGGSGPPHG